ncbi:SDR family oxidoreductase [Yersinia ruckeri]|uniref:Putative short-chain dehydrogenase n=1 Tax=Yersinia ruckeri TaxID=29486 RepID=A0A085U569_YERRU|nr:SDR family oxidoreductase [Yersinia ruckeri]AJI95206.1 short chain dehydrogenase family protein [Yersinia ruckeri]AKA39448.1 short-chain dehydrogenase [Yersinia ruckeri]ARZ02028.1 short chain dehydrogenase [Yersinia ruckeri]AUQ40742.1 short-chain dehydrogenase [Yersinia ruckeri]EEP99059.1 Oxidoreductase, short chain dehydrogenase/reductase family protein [Yersinia ruckeri ATCC 29473]
MSATKKTALIIGASRGLGLGLVDELNRRGWSVTATTRNHAKETGANSTRWLMLDINQPDSIDAFLPQIIGQNFDLIFVNAGVSGADHQSALKATPEEILALFQTNTLSPIRIAEYLLPYRNPRASVLAFMSSQLGSITNNETGHKPMYSASKAALNMMTRHLVAEVADNTLTVLSFHPGWVKTDMGGDAAPLTISTSVQGVVDQIEKRSGKGGHAFIDYQGKSLPW